MPSQLKLLRESRKTGNFDLTDIFEDIKEIKDKGNEVAPDYLARLFFKIANTTSIPKKDYLRYFKYVFDEFERICKEDLIY